MLEQAPTCKAYKPCRRQTDNVYTHVTIISPPPPLPPPPASFCNTIVVALSCLTSGAEKVAITTCYFIGRAFSCHCSETGVSNFGKRLVVHDRCSSCVHNFSVTCVLKNAKGLIYANLHRPIFVLFCFCSFFFFFFFGSFSDPQKLPCLNCPKSVINVTMSLVKYFPSACTLGR